MMNRIIIPTGYMGSGSSAVTDLISEFEGYEALNGSFEYIFLHCPDGVFDLEDKLLTGNNAVRSDEALRTFQKRMYELYKARFWWPANYRKYVGRKFMDVTNAYIKSLVQYRSDAYWYMQERSTFPVFVKLCIRKFVSTATGGNVLLERPLQYRPMQVSFVTPDEFYEKTKKYLNAVFGMLGIKEHHLILDQLLLPFNLYRMDKYFGDNTECFVVERDPRDVFIANKYVWSKTSETVPYPIEVREFCEYYKRLRQIEKPCSNQHIHRINFEDLIYRYDETAGRILDILGLDKKAHKKKRKKFNPDKSIDNTQMFLNPAYQKEVKIIEGELSGFLYEFPYKREPCMNQSF